MSMAQKSVRQPMDVEKTVEPIMVWFPKADQRRIHVGSARLDRRADPVQNQDAGKQHQNFEK